MKFHAIDTGRGDNVHQRKNAQRHGPAEVLPEEEGDSAEERTRDVGQSEVEDAFRLNKKRFGRGRLTDE